MTRCPHGVEVKCVACAIYDIVKVKRRMPHPSKFETAVVFFFLGLILLTVVAVKQRYDLNKKNIIRAGALGAEATAATAKIVKKVPKGWVIEYNELTKKYRACHTVSGNCNAIPKDNYEEAVGWIYGYIQMEEEDRYWKPVK